MHRSPTTDGIVVAQSAARFVEAGLDVTPTKFYNDSPSLVRDRSVDGYVKTSETKAGSPADELYVSQVPTAALLANALEAYNAEKWDDALKGYTAAAARPDGQQLRTFNGIYLSNIRLGRIGCGGRRVRQDCRVRPGDEQPCREAPVQAEQRDGFLAGQGPERRVSDVAASDREGRADDRWMSQRHWPHESQRLGGS